MSKGITTILLVDDELGDRQSMAESLERAGHFVLQAADSTQALNAAQNQEGIVDLLVTDISLPGTNGCELAKLMLKRYPNLKILFVSGYVGSEVCRYYGIPITDLFFLRKPFENEELVARVRQVMESSERARLTDANGDSDQPAL
jgi:two-component system cell cycle sensor histidine kinase/response regulator CckA